MVDSTATPGGSSTPDGISPGGNTISGEVVGVDVVPEPSGLGVVVTVVGGDVVVGVVTGGAGAGSGATYVGVGSDGTEVVCDSVSREAR